MVIQVFFCVLVLVSKFVFCENEHFTENSGAPKNPIVQDNALLTLRFASPDDIHKMVLSKAVKDSVGADVSKYDGQWSVEVPPSSIAKDDYSLVLKSTGKHHAISIDLGRDFKFDKDEFVVQYEVRFLNGLTCGGAYIKLLSATADLSLDNFHDQTPYTIMFGPDKCGMDAKLHFIFRHKNPKTGHFEEKKMNQPTTNLQSLFTDKKTHLFTLVTRSDNSFEIFIDQSLVKSGSLLSDFIPPVNPPAEIPDPDDKKPSSWDDREKIPDPNAKKPDDWDESAPKFIVDEDATMPEGWLLDTPKLIADPKVQQPDGSNAPLIENPACKSAPGCGKWEKPSKLNPDFKGKWIPPLIANPKYHGVWVPKNIANPTYFEDKHPFSMTPIRALGLELWSMTADIAFDNFYIGTSKKGADDFAASTWASKHIAEKVDIDGKSVFDGIREFVNEHSWFFVVGITVSCISLVAVIYCCCCNSGSKDAALHKKTDQPIPDSKDDSDASDVIDDGSEGKDDSDKEGSDAGEEISKVKQIANVDDENRGKTEDENSDQFIGVKTRQRTRKE